MWFVNHKLVIPSERLCAANIIFQAALFSFVMALITTPYMAVIVAYERMNIYAYVSIIEAVLKLFILFLLQISSFDRLAFYGVLLAVVSTIVTGLYRFYCLRNFQECKLSFITDRLLIKEIISYSAWNLIGASVSIVKNQIMNILLNLHFGLVVNSARVISAQVSAAITSFGQNFSTAMRPQLIKNYAANKKEEA